MLNVGRTKVFICCPGCPASVRVDIVGPSGDLPWHARMSSDWGQDIPLSAITEPRFDLLGGGSPGLIFRVYCQRCPTLMTRATGIWPSEVPGVLEAVAIEWEVMIRLDSLCAHHLAIGLPGEAHCPTCHQEVAAHVPPIVPRPPRKHPNRRIIIQKMCRREDG